MLVGEPVFAVTVRRRTARIDAAYTAVHTPLDDFLSASNVVILEILPTGFSCSRTGADMKYARHPRGVIFPGREVPAKISDSKKFTVLKRRKVAYLARVIDGVDDQYVGLTPLIQFE